MKIEFKSMEQRLAASVYLTMPDFYGIEVDECCIIEQKNLYDFMKDIYKEIYDNPLCLFKEENEDYGYPSSFTFAGSGKEELADLMRKEMNEINQIIYILKDIGLNGIFDKETVEYSGKIATKYKNLLIKRELVIDKGKIVNEGEPFFNALKWFSRVEGIGFRGFATCSFNPKHDYFTPILAPMLNSEEGAGEKIVDWLKNNDYIRYNVCTQYEKGLEYIVSFVKSMTGKVEKVAFPYMGDHFHIGFSMEYRYSGKYPCFCTIRIQKMKEILNDFDQLSDNMKSFIASNIKKCDDCRYCVQTDKTNTRPKAYIKKEYDNKELLLCPLYPGYNFSFRDLTHRDSENIIEFIQLIEKYALKQK